VQSIILREKEVPVTAETDVVVVGGGPAGFAAAVAAARNKVNVTLVERYGHLGGMSTGGFVVCLMDYSYEGGQVIKGIADELIPKLTALGAATYPSAEERGSRKPELIEKWKGAAVTVYYDFRTQEYKDDVVRHRVVTDPEIMKCVCNQMVREAGAKLLLHSWATEAIMDGTEAKGVILHSKSGTQAILGKVVIDASGDGDMAASCGVPFELEKSRATLQPLSLNYRVANVDVERARRFERENSKKYWAMMESQKEIKEFQFDRFWDDHRKGVVIFNNVFYDMSPLSVDDLTEVEVEGRQKMLRALDFYKKHVPGFEDAYVIDTAPQIGVRESRRITGDYVLTDHDIKACRRFDDVTAEAVSFGDYSIVCDIPYRCLDRMLVAGKCISMTHEAFFLTQALIPQCMAVGQAAGVAAALAVKSKVTPRKLQVGILQRTLKEQGFYLRE